MFFLKPILFIWQLPQNLLGLILCFVERAKKRQEFGISYYEAKKPGPFMKYCAISLGSFIIADAAVADKASLLHESGHQRQSLVLGPFYLLVIGLPSVTGNLMDRLLHKKWSGERRERWYHALPWEKSADRLGELKAKKLKA
ncbi:MAG: hypothetical protein II558_06835 [Treponema sp.]|nr:hypothetical protein [Treponema sp.]